MAEEMQIKSGILGCAGIASMMCRAIARAPNATLSAVGSRSLDKASKFAANNGVPASAKIYGSYEAVLDDTDVDAVYLPLPTSLHLRWAVAAADKKKHVLLEKAVALNVEELDKILEACESNGVQFMDATMWMHHPRTAKMKNFLSDENLFGQVKMIHSTFAFSGGSDFLNKDIRVKPNLDALGALGDSGWYCIRAILWVVDYELPKTVVASRQPVFNEAGVILSCGASLYWHDGKIATFYCSFLVNLSMDLIALGTKAKLRLHNFVGPFNKKEASFYFDSQFSPKLSSEQTVANDLPQEAMMVMEFANLVASTVQRNGLKRENKWPVVSRKTQLVLDAVKTSLERGFEPVEVVGAVKDSIEKGVGQPEVLSALHSSA